MLRISVPARDCFNPQCSFDTQYLLNLSRRCSFIPRVLAVCPLILHTQTTSGFQEREVKLNKDDCQISIVRLEVFFFFIIKYQIMKRMGFVYLMQHSNKGSNLFLSPAVVFVTPY